MGQRGGHVVAVADIAQRATPDRTASLAHGQTVGQCLARVLLVGQGVHDAQPRGGFDELAQPRLLEGADRGHRHPPLEGTRHVRQRFTRAEGVGRRRTGHTPAELPHRDLEPGPGP